MNITCKARQIPTHVYVTYVILHVYYMYITCILHVYYMYITCILHVYYMYITCIYM